MNIDRWRPESRLPHDAVVAEEDSDAIRGNTTLHEA